MKLWILLLVSASMLIGCHKDANDPDDPIDPVDPDPNEITVNEEIVYYDNLQLDKITLPEGFKIDVFGRVENARSLVQSPGGTLFVSNRAKTSVYALRDTNGDMKADEKHVLMSNYQTPNGVAYKNGDLFVAQVDKIWKLENVESDLSNPPEPILVTESLPSKTHHGWRYISFGPDGKLYVAIGAPCNICENEEEIFATIIRMDDDGTNQEIYAKGIRNSVGFTWHSDTNELWFTDNGRDWLGDDIPPCELNRITSMGQHFGYPYCHGGDIVDQGKDDYDNDFVVTPTCDGYVAPVQNLGPHVAPLGISFSNSMNFPMDYDNKVFIAEHGSWNRSTKIGYRVTMVTESNGNGMSYDTFASGWLDDATQRYWGRPVDVVFAKDGSMLISDDYSGTIYRIWYEED